MEASLRPPWLEDKCALIGKAARYADGGDRVSNDDTKKNRLLAAAIASAFGALRRLA